MSEASFERGRRYGEAVEMKIRTKLGKGSGPVVLSREDAEKVLVVLRSFELLCYLFRLVQRSLSSLGDPTKILPLLEDVPEKP